MFNTEDNIERLKEELDNRSFEIDPASEMCWYSLVLGWAIAKGATPTEAKEFTTHVRYHTEMC
jgi:hypothetical protein